MTQTDKQNVPKLRFPGFEGAWETKKVSDVFRITRGQVLAVPKMTKEPTDGSPYPVYSSQTKNNGLTGYYSEYLFEDAVTWTTDGANAGDVRYRSGKFYCTNVCGVLLSDEGFASQFTSESLNRITHKYVSYVGNPKLMNNVMAGIEYHLPTLPEQRKIASFLGAVDTKIAQLAEKKRLLEDYKKGCMQQLFSQKIRFKDDNGKIFPDWKRVRLSELLYEPKERNKKLKFSKSDVLSVSGEFGCVNQIDFMGRSYAGVSVAPYHIVRTNDVVYTKSPLKKNPYGIIKANKGRDGIVSTLYAVYRPTKNACADYIDYFFQLDDNLNNYLRPIVRKGAKNDMKVNNADVLGDPILAPSPDEQRKIADFLSALDRKIDLVGQELSYARSFKQGLLQQMFV